MTALRVIAGGGAATPPKRSIIGQVGLVYREPCPYACGKPHMVDTVEVKTKRGTYHRPLPHPCPGAPTTTRPSAGSRTAVDDYFDDEDLYGDGGVA